MDAARPLRDVFADLASGGADRADPAWVLRDSGHPDLPGHLVAEAVVNFADTAPVEVAEHLSPFVMAQNAVAPESGELDPDDWLGAFGTATAGTDSDPGALDGLDGLVGPPPSPVSTEELDPITFGHGGSDALPAGGTPAPYGGGLTDLPGLDVPDPNRSDVDGLDLDGSDVDGSDEDGSDGDGSDGDGPDGDGSDGDGSDVDSHGLDGGLA